MDIWLTIEDIWHNNKNLDNITTHFQRGSQQWIDGCQM